MQPIRGIWVLMHPIRRISVCLLLPTVLAASGSCSYQVHVGDHDGGAPGPCASDGACDAGSREDAGMCECAPPPPGCMPDPSAGTCCALRCERERCGRELCPMGYECCNESCGICAAPGAACIDIACEPDCSPMDAAGVGACDMAFGVAWDGTSCVTVSGCECTGRDCENLFDAPADCARVFAACSERPR